MSYYSDLKRGISTTVKGLSLTLKHLWAARNTKGAMDFRSSDFFDITEGNVTLKYPHEELPAPDLGRYKLDCEIDDCIVCDKCAKICPVDCIEIEAIKSPELIGYASDGSPLRLHAAKFNIDMAKCCFCGLCTTVCPTECLTMTGEYDYSVSDVNLLDFAFAKLTDSEAQEKRDLYEQFVAEKEASKKVSTATESDKGLSEIKPKFVPKKPSMGSAVEKQADAVSQNISGKEVKKPVFVPKSKSSAASSESSTEEVKKPAFVPKAKPTAASSEPSTEEVKKPAFVPKARPSVSSNEQASEEVKKPGFVPKARPAVSSNEQTSEEVKKPAFVPKNKPTSRDKKDD